MRYFAFQWASRWYFDSLNIFPAENKIFAAIRKILRQETFQLKNGQYTGRMVLILAIVQENRLQARNPIDRKNSRFSGKKESTNNKYQFKLPSAVALNPVQFVCRSDQLLEGISKTKNNIIIVVIGWVLQVVVILERLISSFIILVKIVLIEIKIQRFCFCSRSKGANF